MGGGERSLDFWTKFNKIAEFLSIFWGWHWVVILKLKDGWSPKKELVQIMLCGEKPHLPEKFYHNKSIFFSVQTFLLKTKRLIAYNKPRPLANAHPPHESDWFIHCCCISLSANFQLLCFLVLPNYKTQRPRGAEQSSEYFTIVSTTIPPSTHMLCVCVVCVCFCVFMLHIFSLLSMKTMLLIWLQLSTNPYSSKTMCQFSILMTIAFSLV